MDKTPTRTKSIRCRRRQAGAYAIEFAIVFPVFFLILYAILTYGLIFAAQQTLNQAAESAAREALKWQRGDAQTSRQQRMQQAYERALAQTGWVIALAGTDRVQVQVCGQSGAVGGHDDLCPDADPGAPGPVASLIEVVVRYPYREAPLVPVLGPSSLFGRLVPEALVGRASVDLGIGLT